MISRPLKILVCGGRAYDNKQRLFDVLTHIHTEDGPITELIHGGAHGADNLAGLWAAENGVKCTVFKAMWDKYGKKAGPRRNNHMLRQKPDAVIAFQGGRGTFDMVTKADKAGINVMMIDED